MIVGNAGILVARVIYREARRRQELRHHRRRDERPDPPDAVRGASRHPAGARRRLPARAAIIADVVGPVCETGDYLALDRKLPEPKAGDLLAIMTAGAYGAVQSGTYNTRPLVPEVLVKGDQYAVVRPRIEVEALIAMDARAVVVMQPAAGH